MDCGVGRGLILMVVIVEVKVIRVGRSCRCILGRSSVWIGFDRIWRFDEG